MTASLRSIQSVLLSVVALLTGHGLQLTLLPLKAQALDWSSALIGLTGAAYYFGFFFGCLLIPTVIRRVGHIRSFSAFVALASIAIILASIQATFEIWLLLRFISGCSMAALYTVVESWLNERSPNQHRGMILALYTTLSLGAMASGQLFIEPALFTLEDLFAIAALFLIAATLPISLTSQAQPTAPENVHFNIRTIYQVSHVGVVCAVLSGVVTGLIWSIGAVYASDAIGSIQAGSRFVLCTILGGFLVQIPAGRLSDYVDRRLVILGLAIVGLAGASLMLFSTDVSEPVLYFSAALCGAGSMPMYAICVAHANDNAAGNFLEIGSGMLIATALGSIIGPLILAALDVYDLGNGFATTIFVAFTACIVWTALRLFSHKVYRRYFEPYRPLPKTTPQAAVLDPRGSETDVSPRASVMEHPADR